MSQGRADNTDPRSPRLTRRPPAELEAAGAYDDAKYDGAKYDGAKADSKEAPETDNEAVAVGDPVYGTLIKLLDGAQRGDHGVGLLREADPTGA